MHKIRSQLLKYFAFHCLRKHFAKSREAIFFYKNPTLFHCSASKTKYFLLENAVTDFEEDFSSNVKFTFAALSCNRKIWYQNIKIHFNTEICLENFKHLEGWAWLARTIKKRSQKFEAHTSCLSQQLQPSVG